MDLRNFKRLSLKINVDASLNDLQLLFYKIVLQVWEEGVCPDEWPTNRSKILPKKGGNLDNWRGIMLIENPVKVISPHLQVF